MKISFRLILAALAATAALTACTKEITSGQVDTDPKAPQTEGSRVIAVSFAQQTKTYLDEGLQPKFVEGDKILVSNGQDEPDTCVVSIKDEKVTISTNLTGPLTAVYPAKAAKMGEENENEIAGVLVSTEQDGTFASANICMAENVTDIATFTSRTALLKIITDAEAEYVEVSTEKADIANITSGDYADLKKIHVEAEAGDTVFVSILPAGLNICDLSLSDGTITKTFTGNETSIAISTIYTTAVASENFYIVGGPFEWDLNRTNERKFSHSEKNIVEDPWFTITFPAASSPDGTYFAFVDDTTCDSVDWYKVFGTLNGDSSSGESGYAARRNKLSDDGVFFCNYGCDSVKVDFNALSFEYKVTEIFSGTPFFPEYIYEIGNESSWSTPHPLAGLAQDGKYQGYSYLDGEYKFKPNSDNWDGDWEYAYTIEDGNYGMSDIVGGSNFPLPDSGAGVYQINVDLTEMEARLVKVESISLIGGFNGWGDDVDMTYNADEGYWECESFVLESDSEVKFRMNHDWSVNWGGSLDYPTHNSENFDIKAGSYHVKFHLACEGYGPDFSWVVFDPVN